MAILTHRDSGWKRSLYPIKAEPSFGLPKHALAAICLILLCLSGSIPFSSAAEVCGPIGSLEAAQLTGEENGVDHIYVVDSSKSMNLPWIGPSRWDELREKLIKSIEAIPLGAGNRLHLIFFGTTVPKSLRWLPVDDGGVRLRGNATMALVVNLRGEAERANLISLITAHKPGAGFTALRDAIGAAYDRAITIYSERPKRSILLAVFSDGEDTNSTRFEDSTNLREHEDEARRILGSALVNSGYLFIQVAGVSVNPPTPATVIGRTPTLGSVSLGPQALEAGSLAAQDETDAVEVWFDVRGLSGARFPVYFEPLNGGARVRVICESGQDAAFNQSGRYALKFQRQGPESDYQEPFEGVLKVYLGEFSTQSGDNVRLNYLTPPVRVRFAGARKISLNDAEVKPADGARVLVNNSLHLEAPLLADAQYRWILSGVEQATLEGPSIDHVFRSPGQVNVQLEVTQPGVIIPKVERRIQVVDPRLVLLFSPDNPVEGEKLQARLDHSAEITPTEIRWLPQPDTSSGSNAAYVFPTQGEYPISASVGTEYGSASISTNLFVGPGVPEPVLTMPQPVLEGTNKVVKLYKQETPQPLVAAAGSAVQSVIFSITQEGKEVFSSEADVQPADNAPIARTEFVFGPELKAGNAVLRLTAMPNDPGLEQRLGRPQSVYNVAISPYSFSIDRIEPIGFDLLWNRDANFTVALGGAGAAKVTEIEWKIELIRPDGNPIKLPGTLQKPDEFQTEGNEKRASFAFPLAFDDPLLNSLKTEAWLRVSAIPQGDQVVLAGQQAIWDSLRPKFPLPEFVIQVPPQVLVDQKVSVSVVDRLNGMEATSVQWSIRGEATDPLADLTATPIEFLTRKIGPHQIGAKVSWIGGEFQCQDKSFFVAYEPAMADVAWDGGQQPRILRRNIKNGVTAIEVADGIKGSRASLLVDVKPVLDGNAQNSLPGWPHELHQGSSAPSLEVPWPEPAIGKTAVRLVEICTVGYNTEGVFCTNKVASFTIENLPEPQWSLILSLVLLVLGFECVTARLFFNNEGRGYSVTTVSSVDGAKRLLQQVSSHNELPADDVFLQMKKRIKEVFRGDQGSGITANGPSSLEDYWRWPSWWTKVVAFDLADSGLFKTGRLTANSWPSWVKEATGFLKLKSSGRGEHRFEEVVYHNSDLRDADLEWNVRNVETGGHHPPSFEQFLEISRGKSPGLALILWNDHAGANPATKRAKYIGYTLMIAGITIGVWALQNLI